MTDRKQKAERQLTGTPAPRRVRIVNPKSSYHGLQGTIPGMMTPEDNLAVLFPGVEGPVYFRREEVEESDND